MYDGCGIHIAFGGRGQLETNLLSHDDFLATMAEPMRDVVTEAEDVIDIWPYVAAIPTPQLAGHIVQDEWVEHVYRTPDDTYDHVLVMTGTKNVYLVVVVNLCRDLISGHHLLDLNAEYGLS